MQSFCKIRILKNFAKLTRKHLCWSLFFNKFSCFQPTSLFSRKFQRRYFRVNLVKFLIILNNFLIIHLRPTPPTPSTPFFWPTPKFYGLTPPTSKLDSRYLRTHALTLSTPPTYPRYPRYLADSIWMYHYKNMVNTVNKLHQRALKLVCPVQYRQTCKQLLTNCNRNLQRENQKELVYDIFTFYIFFFFCGRQPLKSLKGKNGE